MKIKRIAVILPSNNPRWSVAKYGTLLNEYLNRNGYNSELCVAVNSMPAQPYVFVFGDTRSNAYHNKMWQKNGGDGCYSVTATKRLLKRLRERKVDTIFIVLLHHAFVNHKMLFDYIKQEGIQLVYVIMDETVYTGKCRFKHECIGYLQECVNCPKEDEYPVASIPGSGSRQYQMKKQCYQGLNNVLFVGCQSVLDEAVKSPLMKGFKMIVGDHGVNMDIYQPRNTARLRKELNIAEDKIVILSNVVYDGMVHIRKGAPYFLEAARHFENDDRFVFIHLAHDAEYPNLPKNIITRPFINDQVLMSEYYSLADLFVFPSIADVSAFTCSETMSCGTPILCFDIYGNRYEGPEDIVTCVEPKNVNKLVEVIAGTTRKTQQRIDYIRAYAEKRFNQERIFDKIMTEVRKIR